jgi:hypothetical protein
MEGRPHRKKTVGSNSEKEHVRENQPKKPGEELPKIGQVEVRTGADAAIRPSPPVLLKLPAHGVMPTAGAFGEKAGQDHHQGIPDAFRVGTGAQRMDRTAVGTPVPPYPGGLLERLEITPGKTVAPEAMALTGRTRKRPLPGVLPAMTIKILYRNRAV